jgi:hypothetical protein
MTGWIMRALIGLIVLMVLNSSSTTWCFASSNESEDIAKELVSIGEPGAEAIKFRIWTNKEEGDTFRPGDRAIIFLSTEREAYVTMLSVSSDGRVTVLLPNKLMQDNAVQPNKLYALFGDDSPVRLTVGKRPSKDKLVICLSPVPLTLDPLTIPEGSACLTLTVEAWKEIGTLKQKLQTISKDKGFNRATIVLPGERGDSLEIMATVIPQTLSRKGIPEDQESTVPGTLTGSPGLKPLRKGNLKE